MRKFLMTAFAVSGLALAGANVRADHHEKDAKSEGWNGVLIDAACGAKQKGEDDAVAHPKTCAMKEGCAKSGYGIMKGSTFIKFDDKGNEVAKKYLATEAHGTKVHVTGKLAKDGKLIEVAEIHPQDKNQKSEGEKHEKHEEKK